MRRRAAVEPVIGHVKAEHRMGRYYLYLKSRDGARIDAVLAAAGHNSSLLLRWLALLLPSYGRWSKQRRSLSWRKLPAAQILHRWRSTILLTRRALSVNMDVDERVWL
jgi:hypothetical protein